MLWAKDNPRGKTLEEYNWTYNWATMVELAALSLHDRKIVGLNPAGSNSDWLGSINSIDGYIMSDKYDIEFPDTINPGGRQKKNWTYSAPFLLLCLDVLHVTEWDILLTQDWVYYNQI